MSTDINGLNLTTSALVYLKVTAGASTDLLIGGFAKAVVGASSTLSVSGANFAANVSFSFSASALAYQKTKVNGEVKTMRISDIRKKTALIASSLENNVGKKLMEQINDDTYALATEVNEKHDEIVETSNVKTAEATEIFNTCTETIEQMSSIAQEHQTVSTEINEILESAQQLVAECSEVISSHSSTVENKVALFATDTKAFGTTILN